MRRPDDPSLLDDLRAVEDRLRQQRLDAGPGELERLKRLVLARFSAGDARLGSLRSRLAAAVTAVALLAGAGGAVALSGLDSHPNTNGGAAEKQYRPPKGCHKHPHQPKCHKPPNPKPKHKPKAHTGPAHHVTSSSAVITGTVNGRHARTSYHFVWGACSSTKHPNLNHKTRTFHTSSAKGASAKLGHLKPGTRYCYRIVASNGRGTARGQVRSFRTEAVHKPKHHTKRHPSKPAHRKEGFTG